MRCFELPGDSYRAFHRSRIGSSVVPHLKSGRLRALAVASAKPSALVPDLPTVAASGVPGYESTSTTALFAPAGTPAAIIDRLNRESVRFLHTEEAKERFLGIGAEAVASSPEELAAKVKSEMARMGKVIRDAGGVDGAHRSDRRCTGSWRGCATVERTESTELEGGYSCPH
jgi:tripartite-type tricarboxylate transporter receptor subunit TctC